MIKKVLNVSSLKSQQSMIDVKSFNICAFSFNTCSSKILNLKKKIEEKNSVFMKIDAA